MLTARANHIKRSKRMFYFYKKASQYSRHLLYAPEMHLKVTLGTIIKISIQWSFLITGLARAWQGTL